MFNFFEELFAPGRKHTAEEQKRLELSRVDLGIGDPARGPIDLTSGKVTLRHPARTESAPPDDREHPTPTEPSPSDVRGHPTAAKSGPPDDQEHPTAPKSSRPDDEEHPTPAKSSPSGD